MCRIDGKQHVRQCVAACKVRARTKHTHTHTIYTQTETHTQSAKINWSLKLFEAERGLGLIISISVAYFYALQSNSKTRARQAKQLQKRCTIFVETRQSSNDDEDTKQADRRTGGRIKGQRDSGMGRRMDRLAG